MTRDEFMELVYETFADEPDNVLANGIIEAADAYAEHEKAQLSQEGTTSDLISRQAAVDALDVLCQEHRYRIPGKRETYSEYNEAWQDALDRAEGLIFNLPPIQPEVLACGNGELVAKPEPTDIDAKEAVYNLAEKIGIHQLFALTVELRGEPIQPELTDEQVIDYCEKKGYKIVADDLFDLLSKSEPQWIPVERELPEDFTDVLVWFEYFRYGDYNCSYQTHGIGTYVANYNLWTVNHETGWKDLRVIAWMPLPEEYKPSK